MTNCIVCNNQDSFSLEYPNAKDDLFKNSKLKICKKCGFGILCKTIEVKDLNKYYEDNYGEVANRNIYSSPVEYFEYPNKMYKATRSLSQIKLLSKYINIKNIKNILEIGPGLGTLCFLIKEVNKQAQYNVIEFEKQAIKHMLFLESKVYSSLDMINDSSIELVISSHSLEHYQHNELLDTVNKYHVKLKENGILLLEVPLIDFINNYTFQTAQEHEPHTLFFTLESITELFKKSGFEILFLNSVGDFTSKNRLLNYLYRIQNKLIKNGVFLLEYGGNRRCLRAVLKKVVL